MNDDRARCHERVVLLGDHSGTMFLKAHLEPDGFIARGPHSDLTVA